MKKWKEEPLEVAIQGNRIIKVPYKLHKNRKDFFANFNNLDFTSLTLGCYNNNLYYYKYTLLSQKLPKQYHEFYYLAKTAAENSRGRKIVTWLNSPIFEKILWGHFHLQVDFSVTLFQEKVINSMVILISYLKGENDKYYLVAPDLEYNPSYYSVLTEYGFSEIDDFIFRNHPSIVVENYDCSKGRYSDEYGNTIDGWNAVIGKIVFRGCNNHITLGKNIGNAQNLIFDLSSNSSIEIGENTRFNDSTKITTKRFNGNSEVRIKNNCRFTDACKVCITGRNLQKFKKSS